MFHWTVHLKGGPEHAAVVVGHKLYSFGGHSASGSRIEVHIFNTLSLRWRKLPPVTGQNPDEVPYGQRYGHTAVLVEDVVYIWGGFLVCRGLFAFDVNTHGWFRPRDYSGTIPGARSYHSASVLEKVMYVYGGLNPWADVTNDMYKLDTSIMVWSLLNPRGTPPSASHGHSATIIGTKMFVFGGYSGFNDSCFYSIRVFDTETNCWLRTPPAHLLPEERLCHSSFAYNGELYTFGGCNGNQTYDLWNVSLETYSSKRVETKGENPRRMPGMCCCTVGDRIIIYGGYNLVSGDLHILDLNPSLKTLCKLAVIQHGLEQSELPHDIRWELATMTATEQNKLT